MCLIVIAASAMSAITMIATMTARIICLDAGTGGATTLREYAFIIVSFSGESPAVKELAQAL